MREAAEQLEETLTEEKNTDKALTALAEAALNQQAQEAAQ
jgi:ferritin-like metal-binding protein YciE